MFQLVGGFIVLNTIRLNRHCNPSKLIQYDMFYEKYDDLSLPARGPVELLTFIQIVLTCSPIGEQFTLHFSNCTREDYFQSCLLI